MWRFLIIPITAFFIFSVIMSARYNNPYKLFICVGKKGSGKSTYITKKAYKLTKKHTNVYTNTILDLPLEQMQYVHYVGALDLWSVNFIEDSVVLLDESGLDFDSRDWNTFPKQLKEFFVYQRKKKVTVYLFSQAMDVDKTIRDKADKLLLFKCNNGWLSTARYIDRRIVFTKASDFKGSTIADELHPMLKWEFTYIPKWKKYFNTLSTEFIVSETKRQRRS